MTPPLPEPPLADYEQGLAPRMPRRTYEARRTSARLDLTGAEPDPRWEAAEWSDPFVDIEGDLKPAPRLETRLRMLWDEERLYVQAHLTEPDLWGTLVERDSVIFHDNDFEVFLDPSCAGENYYELEVNALNTVWDLVLRQPYRRGGQADSAWRIAGLETAVRLDGVLNDPRTRDRGWSVEIAMPFAAFDVHTKAPRAPEVGEAWRVNFSRVQWDLEVVDGAYAKVPDRPEHNWVWSPQGVVDMHLPLRWGELRFGS